MNNDTMTDYRIDGADGGDSAAVLCQHVASGERPILMAYRSPPVSLEDSGWQFLCACEDEEEPDMAKVWLLREVLEHEPTLQPFMSRPPGTKLVRSSRLSSWKVVA
jgi:hypothetical protein